MRKQTVILSFKEWGNQSVQLRGVGKQNYVHLRSEDMDANTATYIYCRKREWEVGGSTFFFFFKACARAVSWYLPCINVHCLCRLVVVVVMCCLHWARKTSWHCETLRAHLQAEIRRRSQVFSFIIATAVTASTLKKKKKKGRRRRKELVHFAINVTALPSTVNPVCFNTDRESSLPSDFQWLHCQELVHNDINCSTMTTLLIAVNGSTKVEQWQATHYSL